jgi:hypothetical protein
MKGAQKGVRMMCRSASILPFLLCVGWTACSEPSSQVTRSSSDGAFELSLKASKGWVRVDEVLGPSR